MATVTTVAEGHGCRIGTLGNIIIAVFHGPGRLAQLKLLEETQAPFVAQQGKVVSMTIISSDKLDTPTPEFRAESARLQARFKPNLVCTAVVITTKGFAAVVARTFLAAYQLVVSYETPQQTFRDVASAVAWVQKTVPQTKELLGADAAITAFAEQKPPAS